jgi:23S rRNA (uracil1939-C5)-methyltransferase
MANSKSGKSSNKRSFSKKAPTDQRRSSTTAFDYKTPAETTAPILLQIERLADDGRGIAHDQGKTIFVEGALVGEQVLSLIRKSSSRYSEATTKEVIKASPDRVVPVCPVFSRCGGCSTQHMPEHQQIAFKQATVLSHLSRWANLIPETLLPTISDGAYGYRQRVRLGVDYTKKGEVLMGFRESTSHRLVDITTCAVLAPALQALLVPLKTWLATLKPQIVAHIELVNADAVVGVVIRHTRKLALEARQHVEALLPTCRIWYQSEKGAVLEDTAGVAVDPRLEYRLIDQEIRLAFHPQDFIQSNPTVNQAMVTQALSLLAPQAHEHIVDLFCGMGNFTLALAQQTKWVTGIEGVEGMVARARENAVHNEIANVTFMAQDLFSQHIPMHHIVNNPAFSTAAPVDALLLDPPRAGAKEICQQIGKLSPQRIVYVSCDSSTFARDAKILADKGYSLSQMGVMDMFPQTAHIEIMALFILKNDTSKNVISKEIVSTSAISADAVLDDAGLTKQHPVKKNTKKSKLTFSLKTR